VTIKGVATSGGYDQNLVTFNASNTFSKLVVESGGIVNVLNNAAPDQALGAVPGSFTADAVTLDGGILRRAGSGTPGLTIHANRGITLTANGGTLNADNANRNIIVDSVITGAGSLSVFSGAAGGGGTVTLNKVNTYLGNTIVETGTLTLAAGGSIADSPVINVKSGAIFDVSAKGGFTVGASQTLTGNGTIKGATTISGTLAPGASPGILTFENALTLAGITVMEIDGNAGAGSVGGHDLVNLTGTGSNGVLTYGGALTLDIGTTFGVGTYSWDLFDFASKDGGFTSITLAGQYSGSLTGSGDTWGLTSGDNTWSFAESTGVVGLTVIPEPGTLALVGMMGLALLAGLRRRK